MMDWCGGVSAFTRPTAVVTRGRVSAAWDIPFDSGEVARVEALPFQMASRLVRPPAADCPTVAAKETDGRCAFFESDARLCSIHRVGGEAALPLTCRMFPRVVLQDGRGALVSLSHFCPTAAALLFDATGPDAVVEAPTSLVDDQHLDGLDVTDAVPVAASRRPDGHRQLRGLGTVRNWPPPARTSDAMGGAGTARPSDRNRHRVDARLLDRPLLHWTTAAFDDTMNLPTIGSRPTARSSLPSAAWRRRRCPDRRP